MARCVDHRDDTEALGLRIGNDLVHFGLRQFVRREIIISLVAVWIAAATSSLE